MNEGNDNIPYSRLRTTDGKHKVTSGGDNIRYSWYKMSDSDDTTPYGRLRTADGRHKVADVGDNIHDGKYKISDGVDNIPYGGHKIPNSKFGTKAISYKPPLAYKGSCTRSSFEKHDQKKTPRITSGRFQLKI